MGRWMCFKLMVAAIGGMAVSSMNFSVFGAGSFETGEYRNYLNEIGKTDEEISAKIDAQWNRNINGVDAVASEKEQLDGEHNYHTVGEDMAYVTGWNKEIYSKGMGMTMLAAVQYGDQDVFNKLWKFCKTKMYQTSGSYNGYFAQKISGTLAFVNNRRCPAPKGDQLICISLTFAANRWGSGSGIFDYKTEADNLLNFWIDNAGVPRNSGNHFLFSSSHKLPVLHHGDESAVQFEVASLYPQYYRLWSEWSSDSEIKSFFSAATTAALDVLDKSSHPLTYFTPYTALLSGQASTGHHGTFFPEAHPAVMNVALDNAWFQPGQWHNNCADALIGYFATNNRLTTNGNFNWALDGTPRGGEGGEGGEVPIYLRSFLAMNVPHCSNAQEGKVIMDDFWDLPYLQDKFSRNPRSIEYLLGLLHLSGRFKIYGPNSSTPIMEPKAGLDEAVSSGTTPDAAVYDVRGRRIMTPGVARTGRGLRIVDHAPNGQNIRTTQVDIPR